MEGGTGGEDHSTTRGPRRVPVAFREAVPDSASAGRAVLVERGCSEDAGLPRWGVAILRPTKTKTFSTTRSHALRHCLSPNRPRHQVLKAPPGTPGRVG